MNKESMTHSHLATTTLFLLSVTLALRTDVAGGAAPATLGGHLAIWDTQRVSDTPLDGRALADTSSWKRITRGLTVDSFRGDAVLTGGPTIVVLRGGAATMEVYSARAGEVVLRTQLQLLASSGEAASRLENVRLLEISRSAARVEATYRTRHGGRLTAQVRVRRASIATELEPGEGAGKLRVSTSGRYAILPDFFADDMVLDARSIAAPSVDLPSENFLLLTTDKEDSIVMCTFENRNQEVRVSLDGTGDDRTVSSSEIGFGRGRKIWVALMTGPRIWHELDVDAERNNKRIQLKWTAPFPAQWRVDFTRKNKLSDSWEVLLPDTDGSGYLKPTWLGKGATRITPDRKRWTTVLGWFDYPCWIDHDGHAYIQPMKHRVMTFKGPAIIYPINRLARTPSDRFTVVDVVRNTLGVGPCEYILNVEGQKQEYKGRATCACRDALTAIYSKRRQQQKQQEIEQILDDGLAFVTHIRGRITKYLAFARQMRQYLAEQKKRHSELTTFLDAMDQIVRQFETQFDAKRDLIKSPAHVAQMNEQFRKTLMRADGPDTMKKLKQYTRALTRIGGNQDELVGQCRWTAKTLRQQAGIAMAADPRCAEIAQHIRNACQKVMQKPATYEAARH